MRLAEAGLESSRTGARVDLPELAVPELAAVVPPMAVVATIDAAGRGRARPTLSDAPAFHRPTAPLRSRVAYAAAHVVPRVAAENVPGAPADIDWDATLAFRHHVWSWGLGVADAMDTAQRNMGLDAEGHP